MFGLKSWGHHLTNVVLHALNAALVFLLLRQLTGAWWRSLMVAWLFAIHPLRVESVAWVAERKDVLSGCFGLLSLIFYARYARQRSMIESREPTALPLPAAGVCPVALNYALGLFFLALGLMSKPMLVTWPFVMLLLDYWPLSRLRLSSVRALVAEKLPLFLLAALSSGVTFVVQKQGGAVSGSIPFPDRVANALVSYCRYLGKLFWPADLAALYPGVNHWPMAVVAAGAVLLAVLSVVATALRRSHPFVLVGWLWFLGTLVPVIGLVQVGQQSMADRYSYLPSIGILLVLVWGAHELSCGWRHQRVAAIAIAVSTGLVCAGLTRQQLGYWKDSETLFRRTLGVTENNYIAHTSLGAALDAKGQNDEAFSQYQEAIRLKPDYALAHNNLGTALVKKGQADEAINQFREALRLKPDSAETYYNLGTTLAERGQSNEAISQFQAAIRLKPDYADAHYYLGNELAKQGQVAEAIRQYKAAIRWNPADADAHYDLGRSLANRGQTDEAVSQYKAAARWKAENADFHYNFGNALATKGRAKEAIVQYQEVLRLKPDYAEAHFNLGNELVTIGRIDDAVGHYREALRLKADYAEAHYNLGNVLVGKGQIDEAIRQFQEALHLKPDNADAHYNLAVVLAGSGRTDEAIRQFQEVIRLKPDDIEAQNSLARALAMKNAPAGR
jgi:tetratricopeptide (TPR) repeat protein